MRQFDQSRTDFTPYGLTCELWSPAFMPKPDRHNEIEINFLPSGSLTYLLGGRYTTVNAGEIALFWAAIPHQVVKCDSTEPYYVVTLPLAWFLSGGFPQHLTHLALTGEIVSSSASPSVIEQFQKWADDFQGTDRIQQKAAELEIQAHLLRLAASLPIPTSTAVKQPLTDQREANTLSRADQIACYIAQHYNQPLTAESIAKAVQLHPNYAMGLFRKAFGTTITDFLIQHRISHAQRLLVTTDEPIIQIAAAAGFQSLSRFNEAFKFHCSCSPRAYRKANRGAKS